MPKETMKLKIERLEREKTELEQKLAVSRRQADDFYQQLCEVEDRADAEFAKSPYCKKLEEDLKIAKQQIDTLKNSLNNKRKIRDSQASRIEELQALLDAQKQQKLIYVKNARGAGRKRKFSQSDLQRAKEMKSQKYTLKQIAQELGCSVSLLVQRFREDKQGQTEHE